MRTRTPLLLAAAAWLLSGCYTLYPKVEMADTTPVVVPVPEVPAQANGSIYQAASYRPLFEDPRARMVGDSLTVQIVERLSASQSNTSSVNKSGSIEGSVVALPGIRPGALKRASVEGGSTSASQGKGSTETSNDFTGTITVVVREVLPNGHLVIGGEKQIGVNANVDVLRFTGQVDPRYIRPGNVVPSASIANVRLEQRGRGAQADAQAVGWLTRVFLSILPI